MKWSRMRCTAALVVAAGLAGCGLSPVPVANDTTSTDDGTNVSKTEVVEVESDDDMTMTEAYEGPAMAAESGMPSGFVAPVDFNTEEYDTIEETGFVSTISSPLSTVSADVDTASYANLRRMLNDGYRPKSSVKADVDLSDYDEDDIALLKETYGEEWQDYVAYSEDVIPTGAVRIEEMLNYFDYDYPAPQGTEPFQITARASACPWNEDTDLLVLGFATAPEAQSITDAGSNLVFLIDVSGSMDSADKLPLLQSSFAELVKSLDDNDVVSIVTYSGDEEVVLDGAKGSDQRTILRAIRSLDADGMTNGEAGLKMAYELAEKHFIEGGVNRIVMASDGDLNVGMTSESDLHDFVDKQRESGIYLSVLGFGWGNYKDNKMETLADHGNGQYHYIDSEAEAERVFGDKLMANLVPFADDVKLQVEFNPATIKGYRLIGYENRTMAAEDFENDEKDAGEVGPNSQFTVAYEIVPVDSKLEIAVPDLKYGKEASGTADPDELLTAKLRYQPAEGGDVREQELVVKSRELSNDPGEDWRFAAAVTEFGMLLRDSEYKGTSTYDTVRDLVGTTTDDLRLDFLDLVDLAENN